MSKICMKKGCTESPEKDSHLCIDHKASIKKVRAKSQPEKCAAKGCTRKPTARNLCSMHYARLRKSGSVELNLVGHKAVCCVFDCKGKTYANRMCKKHYTSDKNSNKMCSKTHCAEEPYALGMCRNHYTHQLRERNRNL